MATPRPEYPRPQFDRSHAWRSLNGGWDFAADPQHDGEQRDLPTGAGDWPQQITVPFAWETPASGIERHWLDRGWYRRRVVVDPAWTGQRVVLHFGAVHHETTVWVNGVHVGGHEGGYVPFELDVTDALDEGTGTVVVRVDAPADKRFLAHGKQRSVPADDYDGCSFTPSSGIWQPVWLEARPAVHVTQVRLRPAAALDAFDVEVLIGGAAPADAMVRLQLEGVPDAATAAPVLDGAVRTRLPVPSPRLWSPDDPHLYGVTVTLTSAAGTDTVRTSSGLRRVSIENGQLHLNGERLYVRGVLDQGYWPQTGITAPDDEAFVRDIELAREAGFTLVRKHLKLEDPRFHHHCDQLGMLVWAEPASTGRFTPEAVRRFEDQVVPMVGRDGNHPSIVIWGLYNEEWGLDWDVPGDPAKQDAVRRAYRMLKGLDDSRPVVDNSGWAHVETDVVDWHVYDEKPVGWAGKVASFMLHGQLDFPVPIAVDTIVPKLFMADGSVPPVDVPNLNSEFGGGYSSVDRGWNLRWQTSELRRYDRLGGYIWTELYDIEHETAGIFSFTRGRKDDAGNEAALYNADTVLVVDALPQRPGRDLVVSDRSVSVVVRVSSHLGRRRELTLATGWGPAMVADRPSSLEPATGPVTVQPFVLSGAQILTSKLPEDVTQARLHVVALEDGREVAATCLDVCLDG
jgi:hypothetical protein